MAFDARAAGPVMRSEDILIGSNLMSRVCRTPSQIREQQAAGQKVPKDETSRINCSDKIGCT